MTSMAETDFVAQHTDLATAISLLDKPASPRPLPL
jgi:hypothetical protein